MFHTFSLLSHLSFLVGFAVKLFFFPAPPAEAEARNSLDTSRMHVGKSLPVQKLHDMSFVYSHED